jgi:hypothetical protein
MHNNWLGQGYLHMKNKAKSTYMLFWLGFLTRLIQNFKAASDEKQKY